MLIERQWQCYPFDIGSVIFPNDFSYSQMPRVRRLDFGIYMVWRLFDAVVS